MARRCPVCKDYYDTAINPDHEHMHIEGTKEYQRNQVWYHREAGMNWRDIGPEIGITSSKAKKLFNEVAHREEIRI